MGDTHAAGIPAFFFSDRPGLWGGVDEGEERAKNHLCCNPYDTEVNLGPPLFYHLPARRQRPLPTPRRAPPPLPHLARQSLPPTTRLVPQRLHHRLNTQARHTI